MTSKKRNPITAAELAEDLNKDPEFVARKRERDHIMAERAAQFEAEQKPIVTELRSVRVFINSISDLINTSQKYECSVPILLKHLQLPYSDTTKETIARALAIREARSAWPLLVAEYIRAPATRDGKRAGAKEGLAVALSATATEETIGELAEIAKERSHGISRILLLSALRKSKDPVAQRALDELATDPDLKREIASWKR